MASAVGANELTANELFEISQYEKIVTFHNTILAGIHATIGISGKECKLMKAITSVHKGDKTRIKTAQGLLNENLRRKDDDGRFALEGSVPVPRSTLKVQSQNQRPSVQCSAREDVVAPSAARKSFYGVKGKSIPSGPRAEQGKAAPKAMYNPKPGLSSRSGPPRFAPTGPKVLARWPAQHVPPREDSIKTPLALAAFGEKENIIPHSAKGLKKKLGEAQEALSIPSDEKVRQIYNEGRAASIPVADQEFLGPADTKAVAKMQATTLSSSDPLDDTDPKLVVGKLAAEPSSPKDSKLDNDRSPAHQKLLPTKPIRAHSARGSLQSNGSKGPRIRHLSNGDIIMNGTLFKRTSSPKRVRDKKTSGRKGRKRKRETEQVDKGGKAKDSGLLLHKRKKR
ncbi:hypothetical protein B7494_g915 [Chlorociboria aeruginascens]|nr:hypothetical protein B7494_g915 [Chlorociboria aeruginascens]